MPVQAGSAGTAVQSMDGARGSCTVCPYDEGKGSIVGSAPEGPECVGAQQDPVHLL